MSANALQKISYGLYVLTAKEGSKDNGCIINTVMQVTDNPNRIAIAVSKSNYTHSMMDKTGKFAVSVLTQNTPFGVFEHFGFQSGRDCEKFLSPQHLKRTASGIAYIGEYTNAFIEAKVCEKHDMDTHTVFVAEVTQAQILSQEKSMTYDYYHAFVKPKPQNKSEKGWVCKICGYVYQGEQLPQDFICPLCKHGADAFEKIG